MPFAANERRRVLLYASLIMAATCLPYLFALGITPPGMHFMGLIYNPDEPNVHLAWAREAYEGAWTFVDPFTTEPQRAQFFHIFTLVLGMTARVAHLPIIYLFHVVRVGAGIWLLYALYALAAEIGLSPRARRAAFLIAAFGSGIGWLQAPLNSILHGIGLPPIHPVDCSTGLTMPEAFTFHSLLLNPLFTFSMLLQVQAFRCFLRAERDAAGRIRDAVAAGLLAALLGNCHTYDLFPFYFTIAAWVAAQTVRRRAIPWRSLANAGIVVLLSLPAPIWEYLTFRHSEVFRVKALTKTLTPPVMDMAASYGFIGLLALCGAWRLWRGKRDRSLLMLLWAVCTVLLLKAPVSFQRKMIEGLSLPLALLAGLAWQWLEVRLLRRQPRANRRRWSWISAAAVVALVIPSSLCFTGQALSWVTENNRSRMQWAQPPYYLSDDELQAIHYLAANTPNDAVVLCSPHLGSYVPGLSGNHVFIGHWAETLHFADKLGAEQRFYARMNQEERRNFLRRYGISYLIVSPYEAGMGAVADNLAGLGDVAVRTPTTILIHCNGAPAGA